MSAVATAKGTALFTHPPAAERSAEKLFELGGLTLEGKILGVWEDLTGPGRAECPVCGGRMRAASGCEGCGSELS